MSRVRDDERGERPLSDEHIEKYMMLYKVWSYELFRRPWGVEDTWAEGGTFHPERRPAVPTHG